MKFTLFVTLVVLLVIAHYADDADGFRLRRIRIRVRVRRIVNTIGRVVRTVKDIAKKVCPFLCSRVCKPGSKSKVCQIACDRICPKLQKRSELMGQCPNGDPFPGDFTQYDTIDIDGFITLKEFADAINVDVNDSNTLTTFELADLNGDKVISVEEFADAPYCFESSDDDDDFEVMTPDLEAAGKDADAENNEPNIETLVK